MENNILFYYYIKNTITFSIYCQTAQYIRNYFISEFYMQLTHEDCFNETCLGNVLGKTVKTVRKCFPRTVWYESH